MPSGLTITDLAAHFDSKLIVGHPGGHWSMATSINNKGYHTMGVGDGRKGYAHRVAYGLFVGEIPDGLEVDHLCRIRWCVNPRHLEAVTHSENLRRAYPTCRRGHEFETLSSGRRWCPECQRIRREESR